MIADQRVANRHGSTEVPRPRCWSIPPLESLVGAFAAWTLGYWISLAFGAGWVIAVGLAIVIGLGGVIASHRAQHPSTTKAAGEPPSPELVVVVVMVAAWPVLFDLGRSVVGGVAVALLALRAGYPLRRRSGTTPTWTLLAVVASGAIATAVYFVGWWGVVAATGAISTFGVTGWRLPGEFRVSDHGSTSAGGDQPGTGGRVPKRVQQAIDSLVTKHSLWLALLGLTLAVWQVGSGPFWASDNTYYLDKATNYSNRPWSFPVRDFMFGVDGVVHVPFGNIIASNEPLVGVVSAVTGVSAFSVMFAVVVPLTMAAIPFAGRSAARGLGLPHPSLAGGLMAATIILTTSTPTASLYATASYGKTVGQLVLAPVLLGALGRLTRSPSPRNTALVVVAGVALVGTSPSIALSAIIAVAAFGVVAVWRVTLGWWSGAERESSTLHRSIACALVPVTFFLVFTLFAKFFQDSAGEAQFADGFRSFDSARDAWELAYGASRDDPLAVFLIIGSFMALPFVIIDVWVRRAVSLLLLALAVVILNDVGFDLVVGRLLDLNSFAWRFFWVLPGSLVVGLVAAHADQQRRVKWMTVAAVTIGLGLSGPSISDGSLMAQRDQSPIVWELPRNWPWQTGIGARPLETAEMMLEITPGGGRYLALPLVEEVATALDTDRFPIVTRVSYLRVVAADPSTPVSFRADDRLLLAQAIRGSGAGRERDIAGALERLRVDTVCIGDKATEELRTAVSMAYERFGGEGVCELWSRSSSAT